MPRLKTPLVVCSLLAFGTLFAARHDDLVVHMTFDNEAFPLQNFAPDSHAIDITVVGDAIAPTWVAGKFGRAAKFTAGSTAGLPRLTRDWAISLGRLDRFYQGSFTAAFWVNLSASNPGMLFTNKRNNGMSTGWGFGAARGRHFVLNPIGGTGFASGANLQHGKWTHLATVVDRSVGKAFFYVNGRRYGEYALPSVDATLGDSVATVIGAAGTGEFGADALVDEVAIWKRALTEVELASIGAEGKRIPEPAAYGWMALGTAGVVALVARRRRRA